MSPTAMIVTRTPYRISFFGGGTDYPGWFRDHGGSVLATTINRYCYINCRLLPPFFEHKSRIVWSRIESVLDHSEIVHPSIRAVLQTLQIAQGVEIHHHGDLPARSGLGSSSAFTVGVLHAIHAMRGQLVGKRTLAEEAIYIEQEVLKENVGVQDQIQTAFGGFNRIDIARDGQFEVRPLCLTQERIRSLESNLLLFYTGVARDASNVAAAQVAAIPQRKSELRDLGGLVDEAAAILSGSGDIREFGRLLHQSWQIKRTLTDKIAPAFVDEIYDAAIAAGANGGKLLGAGGGGFMLFFVEADRRKGVVDALKRLLSVPFTCERHGSQIIFYEPNGFLGDGETSSREYVRYGFDNN